MPVLAVGAGRRRPGFKLTFDGLPTSRHWLTSEMIDHCHGRCHWRMMVRQRDLAFGLMTRRDDDSNSTRSPDGGWGFSNHHPSPSQRAAALPVRIIQSCPGHFDSESRTPGSQVGGATCRQISAHTAESLEMILFESSPCLNVTVADPSVINGSYRQPVGDSRPGRVHWARPRV